MALTPQDLLALYVERVPAETLKQRIIALLGTLTPGQRASAFGMLQADLASALGSQEDDVSDQRAELQALIADVQAADPPGGGG